MTRPRSRRRAQSARRSTTLLKVIAVTGIESNRIVGRRLPRRELDSGKVRCRVLNRLEQSFYHALNSQVLGGVRNTCLLAPAAQVTRLLDITDHLLCEGRVGVASCKPTCDRWCQVGPLRTVEGPIGSRE